MPFLHNIILQKFEFELLIFEILKYIIKNKNQVFIFFVKNYSENQKQEIY